MKPIIFLLALTLFIVGVGIKYPSYVHEGFIDVTPVQPQSDHLDPDKIFTLVNEYRINHGLNKLASNSAMCPFAYKRLSEIHKDFSHNGFENVKYAFKYTYAGENLIHGFENENLVVSEWIKSPVHLKNITNQNYTHTCVVTDKDYAVQIFSNL